MCTASVTNFLDVKRDGICSWKRSWKTKWSMSNIILGNSRGSKISNGIDWFSWFYRNFREFDVRKIPGVSKRSDKIANFAHIVKCKKKNDIEVEGKFLQIRMNEKKIECLTHTHTQKTHEGKNINPILSSSLQRLAVNLPFFLYWCNITELSRRKMTLAHFSEGRRN